MKLISKDNILSCSDLLTSWGLSIDVINTLASFQCNPKHVEWLKQFIVSNEFINDCKGLTFAICEFNDIYNLLQVNGMNKTISTPYNIEGMFSILPDGTPLMTVIPSKFSIANFRHELIHYDQFKRGDCKVIDNQSYYLGIKKPSLFEQSLSMREQFKLPWELEAYAYMYNDDELEETYRKAEQAIINNTDKDIVNDLRIFHAYCITEAKRILPFKHNIKLQYDYRIVVTARYTLVFKYEPIKQGYSHMLTRKSILSKEISNEIVHCMSDDEVLSLCSLNDL